MTNQNENKGHRGENVAKTYLQKHGYAIIANNYRAHLHKDKPSSKNGLGKIFAEIDIIARKDDILVFIEVKNRTALQRYGSPQESITPQKQLKIIQAATSFVEENNLHDLSIRFDAICLVELETGWIVRHIRNIF